MPVFLTLFVEQWRRQWLHIVRPVAIRSCAALLLGLSGVVATSGHATAQERWPHSFSLYGEQEEPDTLSTWEHALSREASAFLHILQQNTQPEPGFAAPTTTVDANCRWCRTHPIPDSLEGIGGTSQHLLSLFLQTPSLYLALDSVSLSPMAPCSASLFSYLGVHPSCALAHLRLYLAYKLYHRNLYLESSQGCDLAIPALEAHSTPYTEFSALSLQAANLAQLGIYSEAIPIAQKAQRLANELADSALIATAFCNLGSIYLAKGTPLAAIEYYTEAVNITRQLPAPERKRRLSARLTRLAKAYLTANRPLDAKNAISQAINANTAPQASPLFLEQCVVQGDVYSALGKLNKAEASYLSALILAKDCPNSPTICIALRQMGDLRHQQGLYTEACGYYAQAYQAADSLQLLDSKISILYRLYKSNLHLDRELALLYLSRYSTLRDSTHNADLVQQLNNLYIRYSTELKQKQIELQNEQLARASMENTLLALTVELAALLIAFILHLFYRKKRKVQLLIDENRDRINTFTSIAHNTKNNSLSLRDGTRQLVEYFHSFTPQEMLQFCQEIYKTANLHNQQIHSLFNWASGQLNAEVYQPENFCLAELLQECIMADSAALHAKGITIVPKIDDRNSQVYADEKMTRTIITNLISNAIKFSHPNTSIQVGLQNTRRGPQLWIRDSGIGIPPQMLANLGRYGQNIHRTGTNGEEGSGLGLLTAFHLANRTGIQIKASSRPGLGTTFTLLFTLRTPPPLKSQQKLSIRMAHMLGLNPLPSRWEKT